MFTKQDLKRMQATGEWPLVQSNTLAGKYSDRWDMAEKLFEKLDHEKFLHLHRHRADEIRVEEWRDEVIGHKSFATRYDAPIFSYDLDTMCGPHDWENDSPGDTQIGDYVIRKKLYITHWTREQMDDIWGEFPELEYFVNMHSDFMPTLEHYANECFEDQHADIEKYVYKLMIIQYTYPTATEDTLVEHRKFNTERFGPDHCDETLGGLHLGENYKEFEAQNTLTGEYEPIPGLEENTSLWMFGEDSERSGWKPTYHQMIHNPTPGLGTRYSIIFDLNARYKGED